MGVKIALVEPLALLNLFFGNCPKEYQKNKGYHLFFDN